MCEDITLTEEQKELVDKNYRLVYSFAKNNNINFEQYSDILSIGLCKAAAIYDKNKGNFSTIAYKCMKTELYHHWRKSKNKSAIPYDMLVSYDDSFVSCCDNYSDEEDKENAIADAFTDYTSCEEMRFLDMCSDIEDKLEDKEKIVFRLLLKRHTYNEIADILKCTEQNVSYYVNNIRKKTVTYFGYN